MNKVAGGARNFIKKETLAQVFSCEFYEIFKNAFFTEHLWTTAFDFFISASNNYDDTYTQSESCLAVAYPIHFQPQLNNFCHLVD